MNGKTIMIVDDDRGFAQSLAVMLGNSGYRTCVSYDPASALVQARSQPVDCALIDYNLGASLGTTLLSRLDEEGYSFPMIMLTGYGDVRTATQAMKLGASDFLEKPYEPEALIEALETALSKASKAAQATDGIREARRMLRMLTERESEIVDAIVAGRSSKQIAEALSVSQRTVEAHRANVLQKLGISNTASLVRLAVIAGMGSPND
ncbi:response regulator transcription factor [Aestuariivirga sp.]|jgi:two-component system response regulator FixJ|uniref:response regulator transcription factor n=1 Tax=Aestuariivirga sp. TaxID=2650926 RepID=UPI003783435B